MGDIVDLLAMKKRVHWPEAHNRVLSRFMKLSRRKRSKVIYVPGNHDHVFRTMVGNDQQWLNIKNLSTRFYASGQNLFTISKFDLWDNEMGGNGLGYPPQRIMNIGLQINF